SAMILAAGPFTAFPPTIGDTATTGAPLARNAARRLGTARIGSMLSQGFDGPMTMPARSGDDRAAMTAADACAVAAPSKPIARTTGRHWSRTKYSWKLSVPASVF